MHIGCADSRGCIVSWIPVPHLSTPSAPESPFPPQSPLNWVLPVLPPHPSSFSSTISLPCHLDIRPSGSPGRDFLGFWDISGTLGRLGQHNAHQAPGDCAGAQVEGVKESEDESMTGMQ